MDGPIYTLVLGECELELVPKELWKDPLVQSRASKRGKNPGELILDSGEFHKGMRGAIPDWERRGRPDLVYFALVIATDSPAFSDGRLEIVLHLRGDKIVWIRQGVRPPKEYSRFLGLAEQLLSKGRVPVEGEWLMKLEPEKISLPELLKSLGKETIVFDTGERIFSAGEFSEIVRDGIPRTFLIGGFPHGTFQSKPEGKRITISSKELLAGTVVGFLSAALGDKEATGK